MNQVRGDSVIHEMEGNFFLGSWKVRYFYSCKGLKIIESTETEKCVLNDIQIIDLFDMTKKNNNKKIAPVIKKNKTEHAHNRTTVT